MSGTEFPSCFTPVLSYDRRPYVLTKVISNKFYTQILPKRLAVEHIFSFIFMAFPSYQKTAKLTGFD